MPHHRPGWALPNGHVVHSQSEVALCEFLEQAGAVHTHWSLTFNLPITRTAWRLFVPSIVLTDLKQDRRTILIEPVNSLQLGGLRRLQSFKKRYGADYYVVILTRRVWHRRIPADAYDAIFHVEDFEGLGEFLRELTN